MFRSSGISSNSSIAFSCLTSMHGSSHFGSRFGFPCFALFSLHAFLCVCVVVDFWRIEC